jgi:hypothetical protein
MGLPALVVLMVLGHTAFAGGRVALTLAAIRIGGSPLEVGLVVSLLAIEAGLLLAPLPSLAGMGASSRSTACFCER